MRSRVGRSLAGERHGLEMTALPNPALEARFADFTRKSESEQALIVCPAHHQSFQPEQIGTRLLYARYVRHCGTVSGLAEKPHLSLSEDASGIVKRRRSGPELSLELFFLHR